MASDLFCQENSLYLNSYISPFITNAACTGSEYYPDVYFSVKKQWLGFPNSPSTYFISGNIRLGQRDFYNSQGLLNKTPFNLSDRIRIGAAIFQDRNGPVTNTGGLLSYAYHVPLRNDESRLSFGLSAFIVNYAINSSILKSDQGDDYYLLNGPNNIIKLNFGFGIYYYTNNYYCGLSASKLLPGISNAGEYIKMEQSYFLMGGYKFKGDYNVTIFEPSIEIKKLPNENLIFDTHAKFYVKKLNWLAISYSTSKLLNIQFALQINRRTYIGYNYGYSMGPNCRL